jgi:signal transduction histidine kinase
VAATAEDTSIVPAGLSVEVLVAGVAFSVGAGLTGLSALSSQDPPSSLLLLGWPVLAVVGGVLLDQHPGAPLARCLTVLSLAPVLVVGWALIRTHDVESADLAAAAAELAALLGCAVAIAVPWSFHAPRPLPAGGGLAAVAGVGALLVLGADAQQWDAAVRAVGWGLAVLGTAGVWGMVAGPVRALGRTVRRRIGWLLAALSAGGVVVAAAWALLPGTAGYYATCGALMMGAITIANLWLRADFRPLDEHLLDLGLVVGIVVVSAVTAGLVRLGSEIADRPSPGTTMVFTALLTAAMAAPAALWVRRSTLARRYGSGLIPPEDVAAITADLHAKTEPRDLLDKAARMVAAASGSTEARIVLGDDDPSAPEQWLVHPLEVGGDRVGSLLIESPDPEGPEARQVQVVAQLVPTVALVARAVGLAVEAEHARRDVARERDVERKRVMGDLHDGLGPVLAGMSMRVQAALRTPGSGDTETLLADLAADLAASRTDLRRIVSGITPSVLDDGDLESALHSLVRSFGEPVDGPRVSLVVPPGVAASPAVAVAVYRCVAEGVTNALRHAAASAIDVRVEVAPDLIRVDVVDDGRGGPVVPGVGLSSLSQRARSLGGCLQVGAAEPGGTHLHLELPMDAREQVRP